MSKDLYTDLFDHIPFRVTGGEAYSYECYGKDARYLDLECNVTIIFDECTRDIYAITMWDSVADQPEVIWRDPLHSADFFEEMRRRCGLGEEDDDRDDLIEMRLATTEDFACVVETIRERFLESDEIEGKRHNQHPADPQLAGIPSNVAL